MQYRMIALDLDGTLIGPDDEVHAEDLAAVARARAAGALVVPCTGRCWAESRRYLHAIPDARVGVFVTGAILNETESGRGLHAIAIEPDVTLQLVRHLAHFPEAVLVFCDRSQADCDYLVTGQGDLTGNTRWWFDFNGLAVREVREPEEADLQHALRVGMVAPHSRMEEAVTSFDPELAEHLLIHYFDAVQMPGEEAMSVLEVFAPGVDKWRGLRVLAAEHGIEPEQIAVIGDQINDLAMLRGAGCGIAMGNAPEMVKEAADRITASNAEQGVSQAIDRLIDGEW